MKKQLVVSIVSAVTLLVASVVMVANADTISSKISKNRIAETNLYAASLSENTTKSYSEEPEISKEPVLSPIENDESKITFTEEERYLLARIAMAEAEGEDLEGKMLIINVVLNRVDSNSFPNSIKDVIFQKNQFSPIHDGRWDRVEPNDECYRAVDMVENGSDESMGALYFETATNEDTWHSRNLVYLFTHQNISYYTERVVE